MIRRIIVFFVMMCFPLSALAGPPILTDDTGTPGPDKWETNIGFTLDRRQNVSRYETPTLDINYGIGERIQLNYSVDWIMLNPKGESTKGGLGNSEIAVKWRFLDEDKHDVAVSIYPRFIFNNPTGSADRGLVDNGTVFRLPLLVEKKVGPIDVIANAGYEFHQQGGDTWLYAVALKYAEIKGWELLAEVFGTSEPGFRNAEYLSNIGFRKDISENYSVHASVGRSLRDGPDHPTLLSYVGIQMRF